MDHLYLISAKYVQICHIFAFIGAFLDFYRKQSEGQKSVHRSRAWEEKWYILKNIYLGLVEIELKDLIKELVKVRMEEFEIIDVDHEDVEAEDEVEVQR